MPSSIRGTLIDCYAKGGVTMPMHIHILGPDQFTIDERPIQTLDGCKQLRLENISIPTNCKVPMWTGFWGRYLR